MAHNFTVPVQSKELPWTSARAEGYYKLQSKSLEHCSIETSIAGLQEINLKISIKIRKNFHANILMQI